MLGHLCLLMALHIGSVNTFIHVRKVGAGEGIEIKHMKDANCRGLKSFPTWAIPEELSIWRKEAPTIQTQGRWVLCKWPIEGHEPCEPALSCIRFA